MASDEKHSITNILFSKPMPNYKIPIPTEGHKVFACVDCGDRFIFESSLMVHINRKSLKIEYNCKFCYKTKIFFNRCQFLSHIRNHIVKTTTINLSDLKVEPLPFTANLNLVDEILEDNNNAKQNRVRTCFECKEIICSTKPDNKARAEHYSKALFQLNSCPVCLYTLPTTCALIAHLRLHLKCPPFFCPECGEALSFKACIYPYSHDCEGFKMMRVTIRLKCYYDGCSDIHPNNYFTHMSQTHLKKVFKCPGCFLAGYNENTVLKHVMQCCDKTKYPTYYECKQCPGIFLSASQIQKHLDGHFSSLTKNTNNQRYPCWNCAFVCSDVYDLIKHHIEEGHVHTSTLKVLKQLLLNIIGTMCKFCSMINYFCIPNYQNNKFKCLFCMQLNSAGTPQVSQPIQTHNDCSQIVCYICKMKVTENWEDIKKHFKEFHNSIKCLDLELVLNKTNLKSIRMRKLKTSNPNLEKLPKHFKVKKVWKTKYTSTSKLASRSEILANTWVCPHCSYSNGNKLSFESHLKAHRDPNMSYQCLECGKCFAVKPSFATHLLMKHKISNVDEYVKQKDCFNENALKKYKIVTTPSEDDLPLEENQCNICRDKFADGKSLEKHFRVHGMAFLIKNTQKSKSP